MVLASMNGPTKGLDTGPKFKPITGPLTDSVSGPLGMALGIGPAKDTGDTGPMRGLDRGPEDW